MKEPPKEERADSVRDAEARLVMDIITAKVKPSDRFGQ